MSMLNERVSGRVLWGKRKLQDAQNQTMQATVLTHPCVMRQSAGNELGLSGRKEFVFWEKGKEEKRREKERKTWINMCILHASSEMFTC